MKKNQDYNLDHLFHPEYVFDGNVDEVLKEYPRRSSHLEEKVNNKAKCKQLNPKFIKDGYMYLLRGAKNGQETGFYSRLYKEKRTIETENLDIDNVAYAQQVNGNTPFISATTSLSTASAFANHERIYVLKIPVEDVYFFCEIDGLFEEEYMIPDFVKQEEILRSFRHDKFKQIYNFLTTEIGLELTPEDLGETKETIQKPDKEKIENMIAFNEGDKWMDDLLSFFQKAMMNKTEKTEENNTKDSNERQIAVFTDVHGLYEPLEAILKDIKSRGITEIYSLGDNIGLGPNPKEVMDLLEEYHVISIAGNSEEYINLSIAPFTYFRYDCAEKEKNVAWTKDQLTSEQIHTLQTYPKFIELALGNQSLVLCHFANDVRCDYDLHSTWSYQDYPNESYDQFFYTNSKEQLMELAYLIGYPYDVNFAKKSTISQLKILKKYVKDQKSILPSLQGVKSYIENPLFLSENRLKTVQDYDAVIQGHVHFESNVETSDTNFHTLRAVGMGNRDGRDDLATYTIIHQTKEGYELEKIEVPFDKEKTDHVIKKTRFPKQMISRYLNV